MRLKLREDHKDNIYYWNGEDYVPIDVVNVIIQDGVSKILPNAFRNCTSLKSIEIPNSVEFIRWWSFRNCPSLKSINIPNGVKFIDEGAFQGCTSLEEVILPDSIDYIKDNAFENCPMLTIYFNKGNKYIEQCCRTYNIDYDYL